MPWSLDWIEETAQRQLVIRAIVSSPSPHNDGWDRSVKIAIVTLLDSNRGILLLYENDWWVKRSETRPSDLAITFAFGEDDLHATLFEPFISTRWIGQHPFTERREVVAGSTGAVGREIAPGHPLLLGEFARIMGRLEDRLGEQMALMKREILTAALFRLEHFYNNAVREIARPLGLM